MWKENFEWMYNNGESLVLVRMIACRHEDSKIDKLDGETSYSPLTVVFPCVSVS